MDAKYYTPELKEFHVGFEFEKWIDAYPEGIWIESDDFSNEYPFEDSSLHGVIKDINNKNIRVKYLDKEDIESLGFEYHPQYNEEYFTIENGFDNICIQLLTHHKLRIFRSEDGYYDEDVNMPLFYGVIKNKSELKVLLKQLGIC